MTNAEKFEEVFGIKISDEYPADPCDMADHHICINAPSCSRCPLKGFWGKQYRKKKAKKEEHSE